MMHGIEARGFTGMNDASSTCPLSVTPRNRSQYSDPRTGERLHAHTHVQPARSRKRHQQKRNIVGRRFLPRPVLNLPLQSIQNSAIYAKQRFRQPLLAKLNTSSVLALRDAIGKNSQAVARAHGELNILILSLIHISEPTRPY
eukprot:TRINITY_DN18662_c0_g2_i1.p1 TRINITY_DN18662_c0_g2~~TRINITY_DN18662_c0_g2_i1.p1  ORF type:complete len:143 (-),score=5.15 TRINITY_DN18662_c0_g2_i1:153-581(-)